jgi:two-component system, OmpR family, response regulator
MIPINRERKLRVLVVDDSRDNADSLSLMLSLSGYDVRTAYDGASALSLARGERPDCLISDINMPGMDGCELARAIRAEFPAVKLMAVSGRNDVTQSSRVREAGYDYQFTKSTDPMTILEVLAMLQDVKDLAESTKAIAGETKQLLTAVKAEVREVKQEVKELKQEVKELKQEILDAGGEGNPPPAE